LKGDLNKTTPSVVKLLAGLERGVIDDSQFGENRGAWVEKSKAGSP